MVLPSAERFISNLEINSTQKSEFVKIPSALTPGPSPADGREEDIKARSQTSSI
jgi:hypothetical protein